MQQAAIPGFRLSRSRRSTKILTSLGLLGLFFGLALAGVLSVLKTGFLPASVIRYYLGAGGDTSGLDALMAPSSPRPLLELIEVTHIHLSAGSLLLFLLCHLLSVCDLSERTRIAAYTISFVSFLVFFSLPWLIVYVSSSFAYIYGFTFVCFISALFALVYLPMREMWGVRR